MLTGLTGLPIATTREQLRAELAAAPARTAVVMTMGAMHEGHASLLRAARACADFVIATVYLNPLQFGVGEDLDRYPRTLDADVEVCRHEGVDVVFAPTEEDMYPDGGPQVTVDPGPLGDVLEGASRPGHFAGVLTVVSKLLHLTGLPAATYFGEKDWQQLVLVRRMVTDLELGTDIRGVPIARDDDGLALSSRNRYLDLADRQAATVLSRALAAGRAAQDRGAEAVLSAAHNVMLTERRATLDYLHLAAPDLGPVPEDGGEARLLIAARVGPTRLIDNAPILLGP
ncbi:MAG: pantoate--beta-alanine ligase [Mycobacteriales bacterium]